MWRPIVFFIFQSFIGFFLTGCQLKLDEKPWIQPAEETLDGAARGTNSAGMPSIKTPTLLPEHLPEWPAHLKVAILLPLTGPQSTSVAWIVKGLEEHFETVEADRRPSFWFIDTQSESQEHIQKALKEAQEGQAQWIIGPLTKSGVKWALKTPDLPEPILLLNYTTRPPKGKKAVYEFSLAPEDELQQMTQLVSKEHAFILAPADTNGHREAEALSAFWSAWDHPAPAITYYPRQPEKMTAVVRKLLGQEKNEEHTGKPIIGNIALPTSSLIFLLGKNADALLMKPLLNFYGAADVPVIGTSSLAPPNPFVPQLDLNGVIYCDMPSPPSGEQTILKDSAYRLQAFGHDAWLIARLLFSTPTKEDEKTPILSGKTGLLQLNLENHHVERHLVCRQIREGLAEPLNTPH